MTHLHTYDLKDVRTYTRGSIAAKYCDMNPSLFYMVLLAIRYDDLPLLRYHLDYVGTDDVSDTEIEMMARMATLYERDGVIHFLQTVYRIDNKAHLINELIDTARGKRVWPYIVALVFHSKYPITDDTRIDINHGIRAVNDGRVAMVVRCGHEYVLFDMFPEHISYQDMMNAFAEVGYAVGIKKTADLLSSGTVKYSEAGKQSGAIFIHQLMIRGAHSTDVVSYMLSLGASSYRETSYAAARSGNLDVVLLLETKILKMTKPRHHYNELLSHSIDHPHILSYVLSKGVTKEAIRYGLREAIEAGNVYSLVLLMDHHVPTGKVISELIDLAGIKGELSCMKYLLSSHPNYSLPSSVSINLALKKGYIEDVINLLSTYPQLNDDWKDIVDTSPEYIYHQVESMELSG